MDSRRISRLVKVSVTRILDRVGQGERSVRAASGDPALHVFVSVLNAAGTGERLRRRDPGAEFTERRHNLVDGSRSVALDGSIGQGVGRIVSQRFPIGRGDRWNESI